MSAHYEFLAAVREIAANELLQESPYPVAAPAAVETAARLVRAARDFGYAVMVLGTGSSFPPDFHVLREKLLALLTVRLNRIEPLSPFGVQVLSGTPVVNVIRTSVVPERRTIGGLIADARGLAPHPVFQALWSQVRAVEVLMPSGVTRWLASAAVGSVGDAGTANMLVGSRGRLGMITAVELAAPLPLELPELPEERRARFDWGAGEPVLTMKDMQGLLDPDGLFQWS